MLMCGLLLLGFNFLRPRLSAEARFVEVSAACTKLYEESKFDEAIEACSEAIALKPNSIDAYITRGYIALTRRQYDKALADFDQALHYDPNNGQAFINRGITYARMGDIDVYKRQILSPIHCQINGIPQVFAMACSYISIQIHH